MSLFRGPTTQVTTYSGLQVQTTTSTTPIPIVWGETTLTPTVIDYEGFTKKKSGSKSGGKGGVGSIFGGASETVYYASLIMGICEGPIGDVTAVYQTSWTPISLATAGLNLVTGQLGQAPLSYWSAHYPAQAIGYSGIAYVWSSAYDLGPSATVGSNNLVVKGQLYGSGFNGIDADPAAVIRDFLTNDRYGVGFSLDALTGLFGADGGNNLHAYCMAAGLAFSPALISREAASSILDRWLQILNCTAVWTSGTLKFVPRGDLPLAGNGATFGPALGVQAHFDDDSFYRAKGDTSDPITVERADPYDLDNYLTLEITSRSNNYNVGPIPAQDQAAIDKYGPRIKAGISAHEICDPAVAALSAQLILQRGLYIRNTYTWKTSWAFCWLDPMDVVTITDASLGLTATQVRIVSIEEDDQGILTITAEEFPVGVATASSYAVQAPSNGAPNIGVNPRSVNAPLIFEPPPALTNGAAQVWAAVSPQNADPNFGGCIVNASFDGASYAVISDLSGSSTMGATTAALAAYGGANPDNTNTLSVDLSESGGALISTTAANAAAGATAMWVNGEIVAYTNATLTGPNKYALTGLYRGLFGTTASGAGSGTPVALLSGPLVKDTLTPANVGQTLHLKFQSYNLFGSATQSLSACADYTHVVTGAGVISGAFTAYAPVWSGSGGTNPSLGNGALSGGYYLSGQSVILNVTLSVGSTTTLGTDASWTFSAPRTAAAAAVGTFLLRDNTGAQLAHGTASIASGAAVVTLFDSSSGLVGASTYALSAGETLTISLSYQAS